MEVSESELKVMLAHWLKARNSTVIAMMGQRDPPWTHIFLWDCKAPPLFTWGQGSFVLNVYHHPASTTELHHHHHCM